MKQFTKLVIALAFAASPFLFVSCEYDYPEVDFTVNADYSDLIGALNNQALTLSQKVDAINDILADGEADLKDIIKDLELNVSDKLDIIGRTIASNNDKIEAAKLAILDAVGDDKASLMEKANAIQVALGDDYVDLAELIRAISGDLKSKANLIELAISDQDVRAEAYKEAIISALEGSDESLESKLLALQLAINFDYYDLSNAIGVLGRSQISVETIKSLLAKALDNQSDKLEEAFELAEWAVIQSDRELGQKIEALKSLVKRNSGNILTALYKFNGTLKEKLQAIDESIDDLDERIDAAKKVILNDINGRRNPESLANQIEAIEIAASLYGIESLVLCWFILDNSEDVIHGLDAVLGSVKDQNKRIEAIQKALNRAIEDGEDDVVRRIRRMVNASAEEIEEAIEEYFEMLPEADDLSWIELDKKGEHAKISKAVYTNLTPKQEAILKKVIVCMLPEVTVDGAKIEETKGPKDDPKAAEFVKAADVNPAGNIILGYEDTETDIVKVFAVPEKVALSIELKKALGDKEQLIVKAGDKSSSLGKDAFESNLLKSPVVFDFYNKEAADKHKMSFGKIDITLNVLK